MNEIKIQRIDQKDGEISLIGLINFDSEEDLSAFSNHLRSNS